MTDVTIRLDPSRTSSENRSDCGPDDPHYLVRFWQGQLVGKKMVLLPFNAHGELVPDDGKTEPWQGKDADGKLIVHYPLYTKDMRELLDRKKKRIAGMAVKDEAASEAGLDEQEESSSLSDDVNFVDWLQGKMRYEPHLLRAAARKRYGKSVSRIGELVTDLVLDEKLVPEAEVCADLAKHLPKRAAA